MMKIGIPVGKLYDKLIENYRNMPEVNDLKIIRGSDERLGEMFKSRELDLAFLSPLAYSAGVSDEEYRIVPTTCIVMENYSGQLSVYFNPKARKLSTLAVRSETEYLTIAARIVLAERYEIFPQINVEDVDNKELDDVFQRNDMVLVAKESDAHDSSIDVCEQWFDTYEFPLVLGCWICRAYESKHKEDDKDTEEQSHLSEEKVYNDSITDITERLAAKDLEAEIPVIQEFKIGGKDHERKGTVHYRWSSDIASAMSETLQILFVLRFFELVPAVKVLGDETDYFAEMQKNGKDKELPAEHLAIEYEDENCECDHERHHHGSDCNCDCEDEHEENDLF